MSQSSLSHIVKWFQVLQYNSHNLTSVIYLYIVCSIWPIDRTLSGVTILGQSEPGSDGNEKVLQISKISKAGTSQSDSLMPYPRYWLCTNTPGWSTPTISVSLNQTTHGQWFI